MPIRRVDFRVVVAIFSFIFPPPLESLDPVRGQAFLLVAKLWRFWLFFRGCFCFDLDERFFFLFQEREEGCFELLDPIF